eukprot:4230300-Prymnesium_polylepis.1
MKLCHSPARASVVSWTVSSDAARAPTKASASASMHHVAGSMARMFDVGSSPPQSLWRQVRGCTNQVRCGTPRARAQAIPGNTRYPPMARTRE